MDATNRSYDVITMGRSSIDLYSNDIGAAFVDITSFLPKSAKCLKWRLRVLMGQKCGRGSAIF